MSKSIIGSLAIVGCCLLVESAFAQDVRISAVEMVPLSDGSVIRFERYEGVLVRLEEGRQVARAKLPKARMIDKRTDVVVSNDESRLLVVHGDSTQPLSASTSDASEHPAHVIVLSRRTEPEQSDGPATGEVWFVSSEITGPPKLVATIPTRPTTATLCGDVLHVIYDAAEQN